MNRLAIVILILSLLAGCRSTSPDSDFSFITFQEDQGNIASFQIDMDDTTAIYDVYLYMRYNYRYDQGKLPATITIYSPSGKRASETLELDGNLDNIRKYIGQQGQNSPIELSQASEYYDTKALYRSNIHPSENGTWKIDLYIPNTKNVLGAGIECITIHEK